jgi:hydroxymethylpyrimidine pyrophosphatase-like HAD family hydrolase
MHYKLLALDLDGTLLNSRHTLSPILVETLKSISQVAHVMIVTGRHHVAARPYYRELSLHTPIICCNGTYIYDYSNNSVLSENSIDKDLAKQFIDLSEEYNLKMVMYVADAMLYSSSRPAGYIDHLLTWSHSFPDSSRPNIRKVDNFYKELEDTEYVWKFVVEGGNVDSFLNY